jgi:hypothetical protein
MSVSLSGADDPARGRHRHVRARCVDAESPQAPVEGDRAIEARELVGRP